jgi:hypothetical protein
MLLKIHETNFFHIKFVDRPNIKCQKGPVLPPAQVFYFNGQPLIIGHKWGVLEEYLRCFCYPNADKV